MAKVVLDHITKRFGGFNAIDDLSMEVRDNDFLVLLGPSGCGKSTLLRLIAGLEKPTSGRIFIGDQQVNGLQPWERNVAMAFEAPSYGLYPRMTAFDNIVFGLQFRRPPKKAPAGENAPAPAQEDKGDLRKRVEQVARRFGFHQYLGRRQEQLSAGHRQVVGLGRAVTRQPKVFLLDDPLSQLDSGARIRNRNELRQMYRQTGATVIYVTHDQAEAMALGTRVAVMNKGVLQQVSTPQALYDQPTNVFVATFIGTPPMNLFTLSVAQEEDTLTLGSSDGSIAIALPEQMTQRLYNHTGRQVIVGVRPEHFIDADLAPPSPLQTVVQARVEAIEFNGRDSYYHLRAAGHNFIARLDNNTHAKPGYIIRVAFSTDTIHVFDATSERVLV